MKRLLVVFLLFISTVVQASSESKLGFFVKQEVNGDDYLNGFGSEILTVDPMTGFGFAVNTVIGSARVTDTFHRQQPYVAWEMGGKFGYFSDVFVYGEIGVDLGEWLLQDRDEEQDEPPYQNDQGLGLTELAADVLFGDSRHRHDGQNDIDAFIGAGFGIKFNHLAVEAFSRYRHIDGEYWRAENNVFSGVKLTLYF